MDLPLKPQLLPKPGQVKVYKAIYSYEAKNNDELSFDEGEIVYVLDETSDGWWKAKCKNKIGLIPFNYGKNLSICYLFVTEKDEIKNPLHDAVRRGNVTFLQECLAHGVSHTGLDAMSNTALYWAAHSGHLDCLKILLNQPNPPVDIKNHVGDTPLHAGSSRGHTEVVETLIYFGADLSIKNYDGETAEDIAKTAGIKNILQLNKSSRNSRSTTIAPEEYDDDSDDS